MALRVTRRSGAALFAPAYQAPTTVCRRPKDSTAITRPSTVRPVRSLWRSALRAISFKNCISANRALEQIGALRELALVEILDGVRMLGRPPVVRHHDDRLAELHVELLEERQHFGRRLAVEVAGRLVGDDQLRIGDEGARDCHALLLAAGELRGVVFRAVGEPDQAQRRGDVLAPLAPGERGECERQLHVLERGQHRHQVVELEHEADRGGAPVGEVGLGQHGDVDAIDEDRASIGLVDAGEQVEQRRLARARRSHQAEEVAALHVERETVQHRHDLSAAPVRLGNAAHLDERGAHAAAHFTRAPSASRSGGLTITRSPGVSPSACTRSPSARPPSSLTRCARPSFTTKTYFAPSRSRSADLGTAGTGLRSVAASSRSRNATLAAMSGTTRGSRSMNRIFTSTVAFARSTVGTTRCTTPATRCSGRASSWISQGWPSFTLPSEDSATSASTSRVSMSAIVTTAPLVSAALENGVMLSPTLALFVSTTPSKGARISVWSSATSAALRFACAAASAASPERTPARALSSRATAESSVEPLMYFFSARSRERARLACASRASACACSRLAAATPTFAFAWSRLAATSRFSMRAITSSRLTRLPSITPSHSSR